MLTGVQPAPRRFGMAPVRQRSLRLQVETWTVYRNQNAVRIARDPENAMPSLRLSLVSPPACCVTRPVQGQHRLASR